MPSSCDRKATSMESEQQGWVNKTRTIPTTVSILTNMGEISWVPTLGEERSAMKNCREMEHQYSPRARPLIDHPISSSQSWKHACVGNTEQTQQVVVIYLFRHIYGITIIKEGRSWIFFGGGGSGRKERGNDAIIF